MDIRWRLLILPLAAGALSAAYGSIAFWEGAKASLLVALSVIAAGVLVRLARGLPFSSSEQFELDEVRKVTVAYQQVARALRALISVIFASIGFLAFGKTLAATATELLESYPQAVTYVEPTVCGVIAALLTYVFVRIISVVQGDVGLVDLQSKFLVKSVERKQGERFERAMEATQMENVSNPKGYGKVVQ